MGRSVSRCQALGGVSTQAFELDLHERDLHCKCSAALRYTLRPGSDLVNVRPFALRHCGALEFF